MIFCTLCAKVTSKDLVLVCYRIIDTQVARRGRQYHRNPPPYKNRPTKKNRIYKIKTHPTTAAQPNPTQPTPHHHHHRPTQPNTPNTQTQHSQHPNPTPPPSPTQPNPTQIDRKSVV